MPATVERLSQSDLAAMRQRTQTLLTPEGAQSWHRLDVEAALAELDAVRAEYETAQRVFEDDGVEPGPLPEMAERWKGKASGLWERAQTRRLKDELRGAREEAAQLHAQRITAENAVRDQQARADQLERQLEGTQRLLAEQDRAFNEQLRAEQAEQVDLRDQLAVLSRMMNECQKRVTDGEMALALERERHGMVRELLDEARVLMGND